VDVTTLVAGPAQAGSPSPVTKPGIGQTAGAGSSPSAGEAGGPAFASLVALALDQLDGATAEGTATGPLRHEGVEGAGGDDATVAGTAGDGESPLDAPVDALTLSVLIALATPAAAPVTAPAPEVVGPGSVDLAVADGAPAGTSATAAAGSAATPVVPNSAPEGPDVPATATPAPREPAFVPANSAPADAPAIATEVAAGPHPPAAPADGAPTPAASAPESDAAPTAAPNAAPGPSPAVAAPAARGVARPAADPLREALAAMAATSGRTPDVTSGAALPAGEASAPAAPAASAAPTPAVSRSAADGGQEARLEIALRDAGVAPAVVSARASDAGSGHDRSSGEAADGSAAPAFFRAADLRFDVPAAVQPSMTAAASPDVVVAGPIASLPGANAAAAGASAAIDLPSAARFEQALASLDPDVRNLQAMVRTVRLFTAGTGASEARLVLEPEHLGPVALTVRVEQGSVSAHFRAETPAAHRWIETHQQELRSGLREQGLEVKELVVTTDPDGRRERRQDAQPARPVRSRRVPTADGPRFEVLV
jgi:hypothetical protein